MYKIVSGNLPSEVHHRAVVVVADEVAAAIVETSWLLATSSFERWMDGPHTYEMSADEQPRTWNGYKLVAAPVITADTSENDIMIALDLGI